MDKTFLQVYRASHIEQTFNGLEGAKYATFLSESTGQASVRNAGYLVYEPKTFVRNRANKTQPTFEKFKQHKVRPVQKLLYVDYLLHSQRSTPASPAFNTDLSTQINRVSRVEPARNLRETR